MSKIPPVMRYHGGKYRLAQWVISHFPKHYTYVEPFGGAAGVLLQKERDHYLVEDAFHLLEKHKVAMRLDELRNIVRVELIDLETGNRIYACSPDVWRYSAPRERLANELSRFIAAELCKNKSFPTGEKHANSW